jgi:hypothetical protein
VKEIYTNPSVEIEERVQKYKKELELRTKMEINAEITRIREFELSSIRMEE